MKISIYELLGLIKEGKAPKKIYEIRSYKFKTMEPWYLLKGK